MNRIKNHAEFVKAVYELAETYGNDAIAIAKALNERGCICSAVAVQRVIQEETAKRDEAYNWGF